MPEKFLSLCLPVKIDPNYKSKGSVYEKGICPYCKEEIWIGTRTKALIEAQAVDFACMICGIKHFGITERNPIEVLSQLEKNGN